MHRGDHAVVGFDELLDLEAVPFEAAESLAQIAHDPVMARERAGPRQVGVVELHAGIKQR